MTIDHNVVAAEHLFTSEEIASEQACDQAAYKHGVLPLAHDCEDGALNCPECPWPKKNKKIEVINSCGVCGGRLFVNSKCLRCVQEVVIKADLVVTAPRAKQNIKPNNDLVLKLLVNLAIRSRNAKKLVRAYSRELYRNDTFFRELVAHSIEANNAFISTKRIWREHL